MTEAVQHTAGPGLEPAAPAGEVFPPGRAVAVEAVLVCPGCGGRELAPWHEGWDRAFAGRAGTAPQRFRYGRCADCGLCVLVVRPVESEIGSFYPSGYGPYHDHRSALRGEASPVSAAPARGARLRALARRSVRWLNWGFERLVPGRLSSRLDTFYHPRQPGLALLDYGCGSAEFLDRARALGWRTIGADFAPGVLARVRAAGHQALPAGEETWAALGSGAVELVRLHHVLEHLYHPRDVLVRAVAALAPGGRMHVGLPHPAGISARLFGRCFWGLECPRHVFLFPPDLVVRWLALLGLSELEVWHESPSKDLVRSAGYWLEERGWFARGAAASLPGGLWDDALFLPARAAAGLRYGDRFHVFGRKPLAGRGP